MNPARLLIACVGVMTGCQGPLPQEGRALYPQRDLTVLWAERHYWPVPPSGFPAPPPAADATARVPDALPALAPPLTAPGVPPAAHPAPPAPRTGLGRRPGRGPRTVCAKPGC